MCILPKPLRPQQMEFLSSVTRPQSFCQVQLEMCQTTMSDYGRKAVDIEVFKMELVSSQSHIGDSQIRYILGNSGLQAKISLSTNRSTGRNLSSLLSKTPFWSDQPFGHPHPCSQGPHRFCSRISCTDRICENCKQGHQQTISCAD